MSTVRVPKDERHAIRNWAEQYGPSVWAAVPGARPCMIIAAALARAERGFYGAFADVWPEYRELAKAVMAEWAPRERVPPSFED